MKKFNIDEFIWFIILVLLTVFLSCLIMTGIMDKILSDKIINWMYFAIGLLIVICIVQFGRVLTFNSRIDNSTKYLPMILTLAVGMFFVFNNYNEAGLINKNENDLAIEKDAIVITNENYKLLKDINDNPEGYIGKILVFTGFVSYDNSEKSNEFVLAREEIQCCAADAVMIGVRAKCDDKLSNGQWIKAKGKFVYSDEYYLQIEDYVKVEKPKEQYFMKKTEK